jgi:hypothetical protein
VVVAPPPPAGGIVDGADGGAEEEGAVVDGVLLDEPAGAALSFLLQAVSETAARTVARIRDLLIIRFSFVMAFMRPGKACPRRLYPGMTNPGYRRYPSD